MDALKVLTGSCGIVILNAALLGCGEKNEGRQATPQDQKAGEKKSLDGPAQPPEGFTEERLRKLIHAPGEVDRDLLMRLLSGDAAARRWAPLGLGLTCTDDSAAASQNQLVSAAAAWMSESTPPTADELRTAAWAIGVCGGPGAEDVLRGWLSPEPGAEKTGLIEAGVFGLGALADRKGSLSERTQTALLEVASKEGRAELLQPLGRIGRLSEAVGAHILEVTGGLLTKEKKDGLRHAIFALGSAGPSAATPLAQVLLSENFSSEERAAAAQALSRLGSAGQEALDETLRDLLSRGLPVSYDRQLWVVLRATIDGLREVNLSKKHLSELSSLVLPEGKERDKVSQRRRLVWLRCTAARLLAQGQYDQAALTSCDPDGGREGALARLFVLGEKELRGARRKAWDEYLGHEDPVVVQAALRLLAEHPELQDAPKILETALESDVPGTRATAAQIISAYPARAHEGEDAEGPAEAIVQSLKKLLDPKNADVALEARAAAVSAAGAVRALSLKPEIEGLCRGTDQALWKPAEAALALLGSPKSKCPVESPKDLTERKEFAGKVTLVIDSDVGELLLHVDGRDAPVSTAHFVSQVDSGFYNGIAVHGARAGFAVQFGDRDGDGYQDGTAQGLPHEISPRPFVAGTFGMSAFSPGSHDTQIFVILSDAPQLHGSRVHLGTTEGPWNLLVPGDVLHSVKRSP